MDSSKYFNNIENAVKVSKPEQMTKTKNGRSFIQVPLNIKDQMVVTLTWIGEEFKLNLVAQIFSSDRKIESCKAGYFNPLCKGINHSRSHDSKIMGETM